MSASQRGRNSGPGGRDGGSVRGGRPGAGIYMERDPVPSPDTAITKFEDEVAADPKNVFGAKTWDDTLPRRPGYGSVGRQIVLRTNYFVMSPKRPTQQLWRYIVAIKNGEEVSKIKRARVFAQLLEMPPLQGIVAATDYASTIVTTEAVSLGRSNRAEIPVMYHDRHERPFPAAAPNEDAGRAEARRRRTHILQVEFDRTYVVNDLWEYLRSPQISDPHALRTQLIQAFNLIMSKPPASNRNVATIGQNKHFPLPPHPGVERVALGAGLHALRGYFSSVRCAAMRVIVNVNVANGAFYDEGPLLNLMNNFMGNRPTSPQELRNLEKFLRRVRVLTAYVEEKDEKGVDRTVPKVKTILQLARNPRVGATSGEVVFECDMNNTGVKQSMTVQQYFKEKYGIELSPKAPVVNCGTANDPQYIPAELCKVLPGQPARQRLSGKQTETMLQFAQRTPDVNAQSIVERGLRLMNVTHATSDNQALTKFGLNVDPNMLTVPARILDPPRLQPLFDYNPARPAQWNMIKKKFLQGGKLTDWTFLVIDTRGRPTLSGNIDSAAQAFRRDLQMYGVNATDPKPVRKVEIMSVSREYWRDTDQRMDQAFHKAKMAGIKALLIVIPEENEHLYARIKFYCDVKYGLININVTGANMRKGDKGTIANIILKVNLKAGGINWKLQGTSGIIDDDTMVVGLDVTHPSPGSAKDAPSIAGIVASVNKDLGQWPGDIMIQEKRQEMIKDLAQLMFDRLQRWQKANSNRLPTKIIVYRDGVSEGQYTTVNETEYPAMVKAFDKLYGARAKHPKVAIIVVGKRHHTRFYPTHRSHAVGPSMNTPPGTVVDRHITGYGEKVWDFYVQAHRGLQETVRPAHYIVIRDEIGMGVDALQRTTHDMCYTFGRSTLAVSICPPAYYADLICERARAYLWSTMNDEGSDTSSNAGFVAANAERKREVHPSVQDRMFYI